MQAEEPTQLSPGPDPQRLRLEQLLLMSPDISGVGPEFNIPNDVSPQDFIERLMQQHGDPRQR